MKWRVQFIHLVLLNLALFLVSIALLVAEGANGERPILYFAVISVMAAIIYLQIIHPQSEEMRALILVQIIALFLDVVWGVSLRYPFFFGGTDALDHAHLTDSLIQSGHTSVLRVDYENFPAFHILSGTLTIVSGMEAKYALFILCGVAFAAALIMAYCLFLRITGSVTLSLTACLILAASPHIVYYATYATTRSLAFVLLVFLIASLFARWGGHREKVAICVILGVGLLLMHHMTAIFAILLLLVVVTCYRLFSPRQDFVMAAYLPFFTLATGYLLYVLWLAPELANCELPKWYSLISSTSTGTGGYDTQTLVLPMLHYSAILFLGLLGAGFVLQNHGKRAKSQIPLWLGILGLLSLPFYLPVLSSLIPATRWLWGDRVPLLLSLFVAIAAAGGILWLSGGGSRREGHLVVGSVLLGLAVIASLSFVSLTSTPNPNDSRVFDTTNVSSKYFRSSEVSSLQFLNVCGNSSMSVVSDLYVSKSTYFLYNYSSLRVASDADMAELDDSYFVLRVGELERKDCLIFSSNPNSVSASFEYKVDSEDTTPNAIENMSLVNQIYSNDDVQIAVI